MAGIADTSSALFGDVATNVASALSVPVRFEGQDFDAPFDSDAPDAVWVEAWIHWHSDRHVANQGARGRFRLRGELVLVVKARSDTGTARVEQLADTIRRRYRGLAIGDLRIESCEARNATRLAGYPQINLYASFYTDEVS